MAGAQAAVVHGAPHGFGQLEQAQAVRHRGSVLSHSVGYVLLGESEGFDEMMIGPGFFHGGEVFALDVLYQGDFEFLFCRKSAHDNGDFGETRLSAGPPSPFAGHDHVSAVGAFFNEDGLYHALPADGFGEFGEGFGGDCLSGLFGVGFHRIDGECADTLGIPLVGIGGNIDFAAQEGVQSFSEGFLFRHARAPLR